MVMPGEHERRGRHGRNALHVAQDALSADAAARNGERREPFDQEQPREEFDRKVQCAIERVDEDADAGDHP
ncbi:hypothetical protein FEP54_01525 [Burkholderia multivorans]|nr:hypothetical protein [Burkholderia multivorans]MDR8922816.1 hypothetical protein [Burkholderia multivorans]MDR8969253.1 hypothetical protein [Burkholderia multivorans]MDR9030614.1 hypothetical protein [Burkholderia multivorans]MDR9032967.1 hypothetical protein [Burkholderia multivorans]